MSITQYTTDTDRTATVTRPAFMIKEGDTITWTPYDRPGHPADAGVVSATPLHAGHDRLWFAIDGAFMGPSYPVTGPVNVIVPVCPAHDRDGCCDECQWTAA